MSTVCCLLASPFVAIIYQINTIRKIKVLNEKRLMRKKIRVRDPPAGIGEILSKPGINRWAHVDFEVRIISMVGCHEKNVTISIVFTKNSLIIASCMIEMSNKQTPQP